MWGINITDRGQQALLNVLHHFIFKFSSQIQVSVQIPYSTEF